MVLVLDVQVKWAQDSDHAGPGFLVWPTVSVIVLERRRGRAGCGCLGARSVGIAVTLACGTEPPTRIACPLPVSFCDIGLMIAGRAGKARERDDRQAVCGTDREE